MKSLYTNHTRTRSKALLSTVDLRRKDRTCLELGVRVRDSAGISISLGFMLRLGLKTELKIGLRCGLDTGLYFMRYLFSMSNVL